MLCNALSHCLIFSAKTVTAETCVKAYCKPTQTWMLLCSTFHKMHWSFLSAQVCLQFPLDNLAGHCSYWAQKQNFRTSRKLPHGRCTFIIPIGLLFQEGHRPSTPWSKHDASSSASWCFSNVQQMQGTGEAFPANELAFSFGQSLPLLSATFTLSAQQWSRHACHLVSRTWLGAYRGSELPPDCLHIVCTGAGSLQKAAHFFCNISNKNRSACIVGGGLKRVRCPKINKHQW